jgi:hypothetical protein
MYKNLPKTLSPNGLIDATVVLRIADNTCIPFDPANTDYQAYLAWLEEGNVPLAAETNTPLPADGE